MPAKAKVLKLVPNTRIKVQGVNKCMKNAKTMVKSENIVAIAIAAVSADGYTHTMYEANQRASTLIGTVEYLKHRILKVQDEH